MFSQEELSRYSRHLILPEFGLEGQRRMKSASVLVVGAGGLGSPLLLYLAAAGVGTLGILDFDVVDAGNLQRQVIYGVESLGKKKAEEAAQRVLSLNPHVKVVVHDTALDSSNALSILSGYDLVADGTDNFATRYLVNDASVLLGIPNVYAGVYRFDGQVSVFNLLLPDGRRGPNYRDLHPQPPPPDKVPSCAEGGVLGVLPGIIGSMQALEVIKVITGIGEPLSGKLFVFDALGMESRLIRLESDPENPLTGTNPSIRSLLDYQEFCGASPLAVPEISVQEYKALRDAGTPHQLIDVREPYESEICSLGGEGWPPGSLVGHAREIVTHMPVILYCRSGKRSEKAVRELQSRFGFTHLLSLRGGILAWAREIDPTMSVY